MNQRQSPVPQLQLLDRAGGGCSPGCTRNLAQLADHGVARSAASRAAFRAGSAGIQGPGSAAGAAQQARPCQGRAGAAGKKGGAGAGQELQYWLDPGSLLESLEAWQGVKVSNVGAV